MQHDSLYYVRIFQSENFTESFKCHACHGDMFCKRMNSWLGYSAEVDTKADVKPRQAKVCVGFPDVFAPSNLLTQHIHMLLSQSVEGESTEHTYSFLTLSRLLRVELLLVENVTPHRAVFQDAGSVIAADIKVRRRISFIVPMGFPTHLHAL